MKAIFFPLRGHLISLLTRVYCSGNSGPFWGYNGLLIETDVFCYGVRKTLSVIPIVLLEQFPVRDMETLLEGLLSVLRLDLHSPCAGHLLFRQWCVGGYKVYQVVI